MGIIIFSLRQRGHFFTHPKRIAFLVIALTVFFSFALVELQDVSALTGIRRTINFQGKLVNANGTNVADGNYSIAFAIYDVPSGGTALWSETQSTVAVADGVFQVELGSSTPFPADFNFNWDGRYLGVNVASDGEMTPRIRLTAVPYAFNAEKVAGLTVQDDSGNASTSAILQLANGKTVVVKNSLTFQGTDSTVFTFPNATGTVVTLDAAQSLTNKTIGSTGLVFSGAGTDITTVSNENFVISPNGAGRLGFGTTAPSAFFDINGTASISGQLALYTTPQIQSTANQTLTLGGNTTGNILLSPLNGTGSVTVNGTLAAKTGRGATITVAANNSSATDKAQADYVATGTNDDSTIETAIAALPAGGGTVLLYAGTYSIGNAAGDGVDITGDNISLIGVGKATLLQRAGNAASVDGVITVTSDFVTIADLTVDGVDGTYASGNNVGIYLTTANKSVIQNTYVHNNALGIILDTSGNNTISGNNSQSNSSVGIGLASSNNNTVSGNISQGNGEAGIFLDSSSNNTISGNNSQGDAGAGIYLYNSNNNTINSNSVYSSTIYGIYLNTSSENSIMGNTIEDVGASYDGIFLTVSDNNIISGNNIVDTSGSRYGINVSDSTSDNNYISGNEISGAGFTQEVVDLGTGTTVQGRDQFQIAANSSTNAGLTLTQSGTADILNIFDGTNEVFSVLDTGKVGIGVPSPTGQFHVSRPLTYGATGKALAIFDQIENQDILTASYGGTTKFTIGRNGEIGLGLSAGLPNFGNSGDCLKSAGTGFIATWGACGGGSQTPWTSDIDADNFSLLDLGTNITSRNGLTIGTGSNGNLTLTANGTGDTVVSGDADTNLQLTFSAAPGVDMAVFSNSGQGTTTNDVNGLRVDFVTAAVAGARTNAGLEINVTSGATEASDTLYGINIENITGQTGTEAGIRIGTGWDQGLVIESGGSTNSGLVYSGAGRPTKTITLSPEYAGGVLTASNSASITGSMTSDASSSAGLNRTYYEWSSTQTSLQDYTVAVRMTLPADFSDWASGNTMTVSLNTADTSSSVNGLDVYIYNSSDDSTGRPVYFSTNNVSGTDGVWTTVDLTSTNLDDNSSPDWDAAGESVTIYLKMKASGTVNKVMLGDIVLSYLAKF